ncbi:MAG TPA: hypothetical protein PKC20_08045, partial [Burkholderiaceae bacterium]|nr:hypothetical protein [Burkholderiaceae bacterium]
AIIEREGAAMQARTPKSAALFERAVRSLPLGVASSFQAADPWSDYWGCKQTLTAGLRTLGIVPAARPRSRRSA